METKKGKEAVSLRKVDAGNWRQVIKLDVHKGQKQFVAPNCFYLAKAVYEKGWSPFAIIAGGIIVGFCMFGVSPADNEMWIDQLMIDKAHQAKGYGRKAMELILGRIRRQAVRQVVFLSFEPWNLRAKSLYESLGFVPAGYMADEDVVYKLEIEKVQTI